MCSGAPTSLALHGVPPEYVLHEERAVDLECFALTHLESFDLECTCCHCSLLMPLLARIWVEGMAVALKQLAQFLHAVSYRIFGSAVFDRRHSLFRLLVFFRRWLWPRDQCGYHWNWLLHLEGNRLLLAIARGCECMTGYHPVCLVLRFFPYRIDQLVCDAATVGTLNSVVRRYMRNARYIIYKHKFDGRILDSVDVKRSLFSESACNGDCGVAAKHVWRVHVWDGDTARYHVRIEHSGSAPLPILNHSVSPRSESSTQTAATWPDANPDC